MEHFITPDGSTSPPIKVPYVCTEYDGGDFMTYPQRQGWTESNLMGTPDFGPCRTPEQVEAFFQSWLYFGMLTSVLGVAGIRFKTQDLIRYDDQQKQKILDTSILPTIIQSWIDHEGVDAGQGKRLTDNKFKRGEEVRIILDEALKYVNRYCNTKAHETATIFGKRFPFWPISETISMSIMALGEPLYQVATEIYAYYGRNSPRWGCSSLLHRRLKEMGWCARDIPIFQQNGHIDCDYYFGSFPSPRKYLDHSHCSEVVCCAKNVISRYETTHWKPDGCDHATAFDPVLEIVQAGGVPILTWDEVECKLTAVRYEPPMQYIAISHVWSDGTGNPEENSLPKCRLTRIQEMVDQLYAEQDAVNDEITYKEQRKHVGFWMDTLCVPVKREYHKDRKFCIRQMQDIYKFAHRVLILDSYIQKIPRSADDTTKNLHLFLSNWHRRLWTLQEGLLGRSLHFQFADGAQTLDEMYEGTPNSTTESAFYSNVAGCCGGTFVPFYELLNVRERGMKIDERLYVLLHDIRGRSTSKLEDESTCLATVLGFKPDAILEAEDPAERMEILYRMIKRVDQRIIFNEFPRLQRNGFRWAPRSILGQNYNPFPVPERLDRVSREAIVETSDDENSDDWISDEGSSDDGSSSEGSGDEGSKDDASNDGGSSDNDSFGPTVPIPDGKLEISGSDESNDDGCYNGSVDPDGGLLVTYPGIMLQSSVSQYGSKMTIVASNYPDIKYGVWLRPDENNGFPQLDPSLSYGLIAHTHTHIDLNMTSYPPNPTLHPTATEAVLGIILHEEEHSDCLTLQHICRARVELLDPRGTYDLDDVSIEGRWLIGQKWRVM